MSRAAVFRSGLLRRSRRFFAPVAIVLVWQAASSLGWLPPRTLPAPAKILATAYQLTLSGELPHHLVVSLFRVAVGLAIAIVAGSALALIAGLSRQGENLLDAIMQMLRTLPFLGLVPLFILWFGIGETPKIALVATGATFPLYISLFAGIRGVDPKLIEAGQTTGLSRAELIWHVVLPASLPSALVGLRYALGVGLLSLVVSEQVNADSGIGYLIMTARDFLRTDIIFVGLLVYALLGLAADQIVRGLERSLLVWRPTLLKAS